ncbi:MAG: sugar phosphate isomerase/epimerase [Acidobacteriaceae bacterium]|nr:sugar phosphate isomerase/epimerase [Acidobacteriaceae bacterium]MBV9498581.1 sugar phosphate isomerase/epimerase [Acidobacteriaceae bacterium]
MNDDRDRVSRRRFVGTAALTAGALGSLASAARPPAEVKIGLYSITYGGVWYRGDALTVEQVIERAKKFGYQGVEIDGKRPHGNPLDMPHARCRQIRNFAGDQGIEIYAVSGNNDFSSPIPEHREAQLVYARELMRMTADLGAKVMRVFLAWPGVTLLPQGGGRYDIAQGVWKAEHKDFSEQQTWDWCRESLDEAAKLAGDFGVTLALQNHPPVINKGYIDALRMVREVASPHLKMCFDARLEHTLDEAAVRNAVNEIGALQILWHYGGEYDRDPDGITVKGDEKAMAEMLGLFDIGYNGYAGFELCHPLPVINGQTVGLEFADKNAQLAAEYMRGVLVEAKKLHASQS